MEEPNESAGRLLVVDDTEDNRDMLSRRLRRRGYDVVVAEDGERALQIMEDGEIDLILLDIMMPGIDGIEVLRRLRQRFSQSELPIIMATAKAGSEDVIQALDIGANDYVTKPLDFPIVLARVEKELRTRRAARSDAVAIAEAAAEQAREAVVAETLTGEIELGQVIAGKYRLEERIGAGTFGAVYRAHHQELDLDVAIKVLQSSVTAGEEASQRFRQEGVAACRVQHPNAVRVTDYGITEGGIAFLVMELLSGFTLVEELQEWKRLSPRRCLEILAPVCHVLTEAHAQGLVHRDIKPENIFLDQTPRGEVIKLLDFGIAKLVGENITEQNLTAEGWVLGTPAYMAPERLANRSYDGRADVYSLGIMLFEMLTGRRPFVPVNDDPMSMIMQHVNELPPSMASIHPGIPEALEAVVARTLAKEPDQRPDASQLSADLTAAIEQMEQAPSVAAPPTLTHAEVAASEAPTVSVDSSGFFKAHEVPMGDAPAPKAVDASMPTMAIASGDAASQAPSDADTPPDEASESIDGSAVSRWIKKIKRSIS